MLETIQNYLASNAICILGRTLLVILTARFCDMRSKHGLKGAGTDIVVYIGRGLLIIFTMIR